MERLYIGKVKIYLDTEVKLQGFVDTFRDSKAMTFIVLKDITGKVQITIEKADHPELLNLLQQITPDSVLTVKGVPKASDYVKLNGVEVIPTSIVLESVAAPLPIHRDAIPATRKKAAVERSAIDLRLDYRWIDLRTERNQLIFKAQTEFVRAMREFLLERNSTPPNSLLPPVRVAQMSLRSSTLTARPTLHRVRSFTSKWLCPLVLSVSLR